MSPDSNSKVHQGLLTTSGTSCSPGVSPESTSSLSLGAMWLMGDRPVSGLCPRKTTVVPLGQGLLGSQGPVTDLCPFPPPDTVNTSHHSSSFKSKSSSNVTSTSGHSSGSSSGAIAYRQQRPGPHFQQQQPLNLSQVSTHATPSRPLPLLPPAHQVPWGSRKCPSELWSSPSAAGHLGEGGSSIHGEPVQCKMTCLMFQST